MSERITFFVDVILPVPIHQEFTYRVPYELNDHIQFGLRVIVPFGKNKLQTGIITRIHQVVPTNYQAKYVAHLLDDNPLITPTQYVFWQWISSYYMAPIGDVMNAALPANFKLASETKILLHPSFVQELDHLTGKEQELISILEDREECNLKELSTLLDIKSIHPIIKRLIERRIVTTHEAIQDRYTPKTVTCIMLAEELLEEEFLSDVLRNLEKDARSSKQVEMMIHLLKLKTDEGGLQKPVPKQKVLEFGSASVLSSLEKKGLVYQERYQIDRISLTTSSVKEIPNLTDPQQKALEEIRTYFEFPGKVCLLHGLTGSGKTEIYVQLIQEYLDQGKQVLFLLPEIALTTQLIARLSAYFGEQVGVYHSRFNQNERVEIWHKVMENNLEQYRIILGARSSVFLPFQSLGLIIVDEEHESSFKQYDPSPRYNGRDAGIVLGKLHKANVLLGTATPAMETYYHASEGRYGFVKLYERYKGLSMPEVLIADLKRERRLKSMNGHISSFLLEEIKEALGRGEQIILFQNRRGYTPQWACEVCSWTPKCTNCDVSLTYHKHGNHLKCHYCSFVTNPIGSCPACGSNRLKMLGFGTEKIEDELGLLFPEKTIKRLDLDSTRSKNAYQVLLDEFESRKIDIFVGTQMITKGLDFDNVGLVGVLDADMLLNRPDFRAYERSYQLISQVAGRAGRKSKRGKVIIQTGDPDHWVLQHVMQHDYPSFYNNEKIERENFFYPPFYKIINITLKHAQEAQLEVSATELAQSMRHFFKERVLGPEFPIIKRIQNLYLKEIKLKIERGAPEKKVKEKLQDLIHSFYEKPVNKSVRIVIDVDPL
jgi:primosomal protein N' (replication factor Y)